MINGFIIEAITTSKPVYISNTSPVIWTSDRSKSKVFNSYKLTKFELEDNFISLSSTVKYTGVTSIFILEIRNNIEIGRERFI